MSGELSTLDPEDQALMAALVPEGAEPGTTPTFGVTKDDEQQPEPTPAPTPAPSPEPTAAPTPAPTPAPTEAPSATPSPTPEPTAAPAPAEPQGDPRAALRAARRNEKRLRDELERKEQELEQLRANGGRAPTGDEPKAWSQMTEAERAEMEENFPIQAKTLKRVDELDAKLKELEQRTTPATPNDDGWEPPSFKPAVQEVIDSVPQLQAWQYSQADQDKFNLATEFDAALMHDPVWKHKQPAERFNEAVKRTQQHLGLTPAATPAPRQDPAAVIAAAPSQTPAGVSDFRGGGPAAAPALDMSRMTDEQIVASLRPD